MELILSTGDKAIVDAELYQHLNSFRWTRSGHKNKQYVTRSVKINKIQNVIYLHRYIFEIKNIEIPYGFEVDHINRNRLDNKFSNLRLLTHSQNIHNRDLLTNNSSGFRGVSWYKREQLWVVEIMVSKRKIRIGSFVEKQKAIEARINAEMNLGLHQIISKEIH